MGPIDTSTLPSDYRTYVPRVTVSVVSHGQRKLVESLLRQLADLRDSDLGCVVLTHNLPDSDLPKPERAAFDLVQLHNEEPLGFSANHNQAFVQCATPWFAVLNPDLDFAFGDPFPALLAAATDDPRLGVVAPALLQPGSLCVEAHRGVVTPIELIRRRLPGWNPPAEPDWLVGAFMLIRKDVFKALGGFDARFRLYCEDVDFGLRTSKAGWNIRRVDAARVVHLTQRSSHRRLKYALMHMESLARLWLKLARDSTFRNKRS